MTKAEFAASVKVKHPEYKDVPDDTLVEAMLTKYPQYKEQIQDNKVDGVVSKDEPGTWWGGFTKKVKDDVVNATVHNPMLQAAAHPQTTSDFLSLILPSELTEAYPAATRLKDAAKAGMAEAKPGIMNRVKGIFTGAGKRFEAAGMSDQDLISKNFNELPLADQMKRFPTTDTTPILGKAGTPPPQTPFNELPLHRQMEMMPETAAPVRGASEPPITNLGSETAPKPAPIRLAGKAPTVEDGIMQALEEARQGDASSVSTAAPDATTAGEGSLKQSGKFGKSGNLGQAGGYSSGRPSTQPSTLEEALQGELGGQTPDVSPEAVAVPASEPPASEASAPHTTGEATTGRMQEIISGNQPIDPEKLTPQNWLDLRQQFGAKKLSQMTGVDADVIRTKLAPGPSRIPTEAQTRINEFDARQALGRDEP